MPRRYAKAPLVEALCEFRFSPGSMWDMTVPGLIYERVKQPFSERRQAHVLEASVSGSPGGLEQRMVASQRMQFLRPDEKALIQVGQHLLAVNQLQPYLGWEAFLPLIRQGFAAYAEVTGVAAVQRIGLRYINRIEIPEAAPDLEEYLDFRPYLGPGLPSAIASFSVGVELPFEDGRDALRLHLADDPGVGSGVRALMLDLDYFTCQPGTVGLSQVFDWLETAHRHVEQTFEACLTDRSRQLFEEVGA